VCISTLGFGADNFSTSGRGAGNDLFQGGSHE
jgi:hypothetical protein